MKKYIIVSLATACLTLVPGRGEAVTKAGLFRVSLDSSFFAFGVGEVDPDGQGSADYQSPTFGVGLSSPGIGLGYTVIDGLVIGGRVTVGVQGYDDLFQDDESLLWSVLPYLEYIFLSGLARPFLTATLGFEGVRTNAFGDNGLWWWGFTAGGGGGVHLFLLEQVSLDLMLLGTFTVGAGEGAGGGRNNDFGLWHFKLWGLFGLSGWF